MNDKRPEEQDDWLKWLDSMESDAARELGFEQGSAWRDGVLALIREARRAIVQDALGWARLTDERNAMEAERDVLRTELADLKGTNAALEAEVTRLEIVLRWWAELTHTGAGAWPLDKLKQERDDSGERGMPGVP